MKSGTLPKTILASALLALALAASAQGENPAWQYTVRPGDTLIDIAVRFLSQPRQWPAIKKSNRIADEHRLSPGTALRIPVKMLRREPAQATLEAMNGTVRWRAEAAAWQDASAGQKLGSGSELETAENASALLRLADGSSLALAPGSRVLLDTLSLYAKGLMADTRVRLQRGQTEISANPEKRGNQHLQILTPSAQAVVRGTHFRVGFEADTDTTREETLEGVVGVSAAGKSVAVAQAQGTLARAGEPPSRPVALLKAADLSGLPARFEQLPLRFPLPALAEARSWVGQIAPDEHFNRILLSKTASGPALVFSDLPNGDYVLRLRAVDGNGLQGLDAQHRFTVFARPFPPGLNAPGDGATVRAARPSFAWSTALGVERYHLQIASQPDFASPLHDVTLDRSTWLPATDLPAGKLYWRAASIEADNLQGPWSMPAAFTYRPGPGPADLGRSALQIESASIRLKLPPAPAGLTYEATISADAQLQPLLSRAQAADGTLELPRPDSGTYYLGVRLVDKSDDTPGPTAIQRIEVPPSRLWLLLLLLPLAAL